ncbi:MAG: hypothetical protein ACYCQJ_05205 [Nitrososphaerales archaeon]
MKKSVLALTFVNGNGHQFDGASFRKSTPGNEGEIGQIEHDLTENSLKKTPHLPKTPTTANAMETGKEPLHICMVCRNDKHERGKDFFDDLEWQRHQDWHEQIRAE